MIKSKFDKIQDSLLFITSLLIAFSLVSMFMKYRLWSIRLGNGIAWALDIVLIVYLLVDFLNVNNCDVAKKSILVGIMMASICLWGTIVAISFMIAAIICFSILITGEQKRKIVESSGIVYIFFIFELVSIIFILKSFELGTVNTKIYTSIIIDLMLALAVLIDINKVKVGQLVRGWTVVHIKKLNNNDIKMNNWKLCYCAILGVICALILVCILMMKGQVYWEYSILLNGNKKYLNLIINLLYIVIQFVLWKLLCQKYIRNEDDVVSSYISLILVLTPNIFMSLFMSSRTMLVNTLFIIAIYFVINYVKTMLIRGGIVVLIFGLQILICLWKDIYALPILNVILFLIFYIFLKKCVQKQVILVGACALLCLEVVGNYVLVNNNILSYENSLYDINKFWEEMSDKVNTSVVYIDSELDEKQIKYLKGMNIRCEKKYSKKISDTNAIIVKNEEFNLEMADSYIVGKSDSYTCFVKNIEMCKNTSCVRAVQVLEPEKVKLNIVGEKVDKDGNLVAEVTLGNDAQTDFYNYGNIYLTYHIYDENHDMIIWDGERNSTDEFIDSGKQSIIINTDELKQGKTYFYEIDIIDENLRWFSYEGMKTVESKFVMK